MSSQLKTIMSSDEDLAPPSPTSKLKGNNGPHHHKEKNETDKNPKKDHQNGFIHTHDTIDESKADIIKNHIIEQPNNKKPSIELWKELILNMLRNTLCYALMPESGKVVVFDSALPVKHAFRALAENDIKCSPVWSSKIDGNEGGFVGFMTVTDFADILHFYAQDLNSFSRNISKLENTTVGDWCTFRKKHKKTEISRALVFVEPDEPIFNAIYKMHQFFIHRMPVKHDQSILCILNHQAILRYVFSKTQMYHNDLKIKVSDLEYKTNVEHPTVTGDQNVSDAVTILSTNKHITAIPICEESGIVTDAFMRSDIRFFARNQGYMNLNISIKNFLAKYRKSQFVPKCHQEDNLLMVLQEMLSKRCHVALILDENKKLNNIFNYYHIFQNIIGDEQMITVDTTSSPNELNQFTLDEENENDIDL